MNYEAVEVEENASVHMKAYGLVLTVRNALGRESDVMVGYPGLPNAKSRMHTGDALLYETVGGIFEVRVLTQNGSRVSFMVTHISPRPGIAGAFVTTDPNNAPFSDQELVRVADSIDQAKLALSANVDMRAEQIALIHTKLDEIKDASTRLGRKDWISYVAGAITSTCVSAAFAPEAAKNVYAAVSGAFAWLFGNAVHLLP